MLQELFTIPGLNIPLYSYGLLMVIGFLCATQLAKYLARRTGLDPEIVVNAGLIALITGVIGARLSHVLENWHVYTDVSRSAWDNFKDAANIRSGGLTYYGGFLLGMPCAIAYGLLKRVPIRHGMDVIAPALMIGLAFGRIGCFMNGCCYGAVCTNPHLGVTFPYYSNAHVEEFYADRLEASPEVVRPSDRGGLVLKSPAELRAEFGAAEANQLMATNRSQEVYPAQLYSAFTAFFLAAVLVAFFTLPHAQGSIFMLMMVLEGSTRFVLELLRSEPAVAETSLGAFSFSMIISIGLVIGGIIGYFLIRRMAPRDGVLTLASTEDAHVKHHARGMAARV